MATPNPGEMMNTAMEILNQFWPIVTLLGALTCGYMILSSIPRMLRAAIGGDQGSPYATTDFATDEELETFIDEDIYDEEEFEVQQGSMPVQCHRCNGVTDIASPGGRCKYCGTPLGGMS